jgi:hypothetical protein
VEPRPLFVRLPANTSITTATATAAMPLLAMVVTGEVALIAELLKESIREEFRMNSDNRRYNSHDRKQYLCRRDLD